MAPSLRPPIRVSAPSLRAANKPHSAVLAGTESRREAITTSALPHCSRGVAKPHELSSIHRSSVSNPAKIRPITSVRQFASMAVLSACHGHNEACCNIPPVVAKGYVAKGLYEEHGGLKTYVTGPEEPSKGIISVFDIFGFVDQTVQGADILAFSGAKQQYKVFMPDWFKGKPCPMEWFPPDTEEKQKNVGEFFGNPAYAPPVIAEALTEYVKALQAVYPSIQSWGLVGYCWGGKVAALATSSPSNPFSVAASPHPAMVDPADADGITVPFALLASSEEPMDTVKEFESKLKVPSHVEMFGDQVHGFMAARADLADPRGKEEYVRGYKTILEFFDKHWK